MTTPHTPTKTVSAHSVDFINVIDEGRTSHLCRIVVHFTDGTFKVDTVGAYRRMGREYVKKYGKDRLYLSNDWTIPRVDGRDAGRIAMHPTLGAAKARLRAAAAAYVAKINAEVAA